MDMEATQRFDEEPNAIESDAENAQVGILRVGSTDHPIVKGTTKIGRSPMLCKIVINDISVSKVHAEIQAGTERTFIADQRSSNGTKITDVPLKPFHYYTILDGDRIYLGTVEATFVSNNSINRHNVTLPETPIPSRKSGGNITPGKNASSCSFNDSSAYQADDSVVPGTQQKDRKKFVFNEPSVPLNRGKVVSRFNSLISSPVSKSASNKEDPPKGQNAESTDLHEMETQKFDSFLPLGDSCVPKSPPNLDENIEDNIFEAETQVILPPEVVSVDKAKKNGKTADSLTHEQSSNFSRELRLSPNPNSLSVLEQSDDMMESQDLLAICETPLLDYNKVDKNEKPSKSDASERLNGKKSPISVKKGANRNLSTASNHVIADSDDESATDDELDINSLKNKAKESKKGHKEAANVSDEIEDDSATDDEGKFESIAVKSPPVDKPKISLKLRQTKAKERITESNIFEAATQKMDEEPLGVDRSKRSLPPAEIDADIDLMPTQIFDVTNSTPIPNSRKRGAPKIRPIAPIEDDIYGAQTQIMSNDEDADNGDENPGNSTDIPDANLDETLSKKLGKILGQEEAKNRSFEDEPTQLMTQNLVDILKPTQCVNETKDEEEEDEEDDEGPSCSKRSKTSLDDTLGFVDGVAVAETWSKAPTPNASSTIRDDANKNEDDKNKKKTAALSEIIDDDDFFAGLPKFTISGTLSNPASPTQSTESDTDDSISEKSPVALKKPLIESRGSPRSLKTVPGPKKADSPKLGKKIAAKNLIVDPDSDEEFDYNDLKTMADCLLASINDDFARSRKKIADIGTKNGRPQRQTSKTTIAPKESKSSRRGLKLPQTSSSLVSGGKKASANTDGSTCSSSGVAGPSRTSSRSRLPKIANTPSSSSSHSGSVESQEVENILAATPKENIPLVATKTVPKIQLARIDSNNDESPKTNRKRRATIATKDSTLTTSPASAKTRRTIADSNDARIPPKEQHKVMITGLAEDYSKIVKKLGGSVVVEPSQATVLITDRIRRTYKFLCAVARGLRVVSIKWLIESKKVSRFLDCKDFTLNDPAGEKQFRFKLERSLQTARTVKFLQGYSILVTPKVNQPEIHELKSMITESGGKVLARAPAARAWNSKTVIISRDEDIPAAKAILAKCPKSVQVTVQTVEFILTGILRQEVNLLEHRLSFS